ncbi:MAG: AraC family transcriptional regulator [Capsulimonadaceae bacterium]|nr:AraC family transcriptional regulator [Capsulimonadaceae bacterium]
MHPLLRFHGAHVHEGVFQVGMHTHACSEIIYVVNGRLRTVAGGIVFDSSPGMLHIIPPNVPHDQTAACEWRTTCIHYDDPDCVSGSSPRLVDLRGDYQMRRWIEDLLEWDSRLHAPPEEQTEGDGVCRGLLSAILGAARQALRRSAVESERHPALVRALRHLHEHPVDPISNEALAALSDVSCRHLSTLFRQHLGMGPAHYQQKLRMEIASRTLRNPYATLAECAAQAGYDDLNYFCRLFRKVHGLSPGQWRRRQGL